MAYSQALSVTGHFDNTGKPAIDQYFTSIFETTRLTMSVNVTDMWTANNSVR